MHVLVIDSVTCSALVLPLRSISYIVRFLSGPGMLNSCLAPQNNRARVLVSFLQIIQGF